MIPNELSLAYRVARRDLDDLRIHAIGAVGIRRDGARVHARNAAANHVSPSAHAERRLLRKLDRGAVVFVARHRPNGEFGLARPCSRCLASLTVHGVRRIVYSINNREFGTIEL